MRADLSSAQAVQAVRSAVPLPAAAKARLGEVPALARSWTYYRSAQLQREYERRREHYYAQATSAGIVYRAADVARSVRARMAARGYHPALRAQGEVHTFACIPQFSWHPHLLHDLKDLGPVTLFDYTALGYGYDEFVSGTNSGMRRRAEMLAQITPALRAAHARRPVDWVFCYGGGQDTSPVVMRRIADEFGIPSVNMSLDDKQGWAGRRVGECRIGAIDVTAAFDLFITSARVACEWHLVEGGRPVYMPEGFSTQAFRPSGAPRDIPVSFVGVGYGYRRAVIAYLNRFGVEVRTFGQGWPSGDRVADLSAVYNRSVVNLGMGGIEYSESLTNVKGRDFEVPGTGGGVYLTSFNPDLARHFVVGEEILCYRNRDELLELTRECLAEPERAADIARRGRERCLREHRWFHRYRKALAMLGIMDEAGA